MGSVKQGWNGRFFEDFHVGDIYRSRLGRTITETDNIQFTMITNNTNQIHFNAHYASLTEFKKPIRYCRMATEDGHENLDYAATITLLEKWAGVEVKGAA